MLDPAARPLPPFSHALQIGATLDGSADTAAGLFRRNVKTVTLADSGDVIEHLEHGGHQLAKKFTAVIPLAHPWTPESIGSKLQVTAENARAFRVYAGQEASVPFASLMQRHIDALAGRRDPDGYFSPPDKRGQRAAFDAVRNDQDCRVQQPRWAPVNSTSDTEIEKIAAHVRFPAVVKPVNGGGGLGISTVRSFEELRDALRAPHATHNYGGGKLGSRIVEEHIAGPEYSIQAMVHDGELDARSICSKVVALEGNGFREIGHIAHAPEQNDAFDGEVAVLAHRAAKAVGYRNGPLQADIVQRPDGELLLLEMGFRQSGMAVAKISDDVHGNSWADAHAAQLVGVYSGDRGTTEVHRSATMALRSEADIALAELAATAACHGITIHVKRGKPLAQNAAVGNGMQAYKQQFGDNHGRIFITADRCVPDAEVKIRWILTHIAARYGATKLKPANLGEAARLQSIRRATFDRHTARLATA